MERLHAIGYPCALLLLIFPTLPLVTILSLLATMVTLFCSFYWTLEGLRTAGVSPRLSPLRNVSRGATSATQRQKLHTNDVNQCLHNKSSSHGAANAN